MKISAVKATIVNIPRQRPLATAYGISPTTNTVVVQLRSDAGLCAVPFFSA